MTSTHTVVPVLTIAGSDSCGGAGIQADIKTITALGGYALTAITAITAQNTLGVKAVSYVSPDMVKAQLTSVLDDITPRAIKVGMTGSSEVVEVIAEVLANHDTLKYSNDEAKPYTQSQRSIPLVVDPVMVSTSGHTLTSRDAVKVMIKQLFPFTTLLTPNLPEAELLSGLTITSQEHSYQAATIILNMGVEAVLIKGGHAEQCAQITDYLYHRDATGSIVVTPFTHPRITTPNTHGTGCTLSSAIATHLALGEPLSEAVGKGITYLQQVLYRDAHLRIGRQGKR